MITGYDHVQVAIPVGGEDVARAFYVDLLDMIEEQKPAASVARGGCWFRAGVAVLHLGVETPFAPARKAHPAFLVTDLDAVRARLGDAGHTCVDSNRPCAARATCPRPPTAPAPLVGRTP